jgi:hypothetical protein
VRLRTCTELEDEDGCGGRGLGADGAPSLDERDGAPFVRSLCRSGIERSFPLISANVVRISLRFTLITSSTSKKGITRGFRKARP